MSQSTSTSRVRIATIYRGALTAARMSPRAKLPVKQGTHLKSNGRGALVRAQSFQETQFIAVQDSEAGSHLVLVKVL